MPHHPPLLDKALNLRDIAARLGLSYATVRGDWKERVRNGHLPRPFTTSGHPRWHASVMQAWEAGTAQAPCQLELANDHIPLTQRAQKRAARDSAINDLTLNARLFGNALFG
jgi:predicted DNA-binding transcriptional regulator AlpA